MLCGLDLYVLSINYTHHITCFEPYFLSSILPHSITSSQHQPHSLPPSPSITLTLSINTFYINQISIFTLFTSNLNLILSNQLKTTTIHFPIFIILSHLNSFHSNSLHKNYNYPYHTLHTNSYPSTLSIPQIIHFSHFIPIIFHTLTQFSHPTTIFSSSFLSILTPLLIIYLLP